MRGAGLEAGWAGGQGPAVLEGRPQVKGKARVWGWEDISLGEGQRPKLHRPGT